MIAVFDTNIIIDALNGFAQASAEYGRYEKVFISRITWMEVLVGAKDDEAEIRDFLDSYFEIIPLDQAVAETADRPIRRGGPSPPGPRRATCLTFAPCLG